MNARLFFKEGAIGGLLGTAGGQSGTGIAGPSQADQTGMNNLGSSYQQLQNVAAGNGPNPAMAQYNQNVQNNAKQQAGAISSIQGISPALASRMATQQGSAAMQNAAAQGATAESQQQLGAMGQAANVANAQATNANAMQSNINNVNGNLANTTMQGQQGLIGGVLGGAGAAFGMAGGGIVPRYADGGSISQPFSPLSSLPQVSLSAGPQSSAGQFLGGGNAGAQALNSGMSKLGSGISSAMKPAAAPTVDKSSAIGDYAPGGNEIYSTPNYAANAMNLHGGADPMVSNYASQLMGAATGMAKGGQVKAMLSPGEAYIPPQKLKDAVRKKNPLADGKRVPGKPKIPGDSYANDVVPAKLEAGGVVIPNSIMQSKDPAKGARDFIADIIAKRKGRK